MNKKEFFEKFESKIEELATKYPALLAAFLTSISEEVSFSMVILIVSEDESARDIFIQEMEDGGTEDFANFIEELNAFAVGELVELPSNIESFLEKITK